MGARIEPQMRVSRMTSACPMAPWSALATSDRSAADSLDPDIARHRALEVRLDEPALELQQATAVGGEAPFSLARIRDGQVVAAPVARPGLLRHRQARQPRWERWWL